MKHVAELQNLVTRQGRVSVDLKDTEERIRAILETAVEGIITIDERGRIETVNPAAERIFGYESEEMVGNNISMLMPSPYRDQHDGYLQNYRHTGHAKIIGVGREVVGRRKDGSVFPMDLSVGELQLPSGSRMFTGIIRDITERKRLEREILEVSERERQRIGQDLHDDLGQRLTAIEIMTQILEQDLASRSIPEAEQASKIARHVREAIAQTRSLARGLAPIELQPDGLRTAVEELCVALDESRKVRCSFLAGSRVAVPNGTIATHLFRIAQEALNNAVKHARASTIHVELQNIDRAVTLRIADDGIGFDGGLDSLGMGLRIMKYRAGMMGATLNVTAGRGGKGTAVTCVVPFLE